VELSGDRVELRVRDHGAAELAVEVVTADGLEVAVVRDADVVGEVVLGHGEEVAVEVDEAGVSDARSRRGIDEAARGARVEQGEARDPGVAVELANGLGEDGASDRALLGEARGLREAAGVGLGDAVAYPQRVHHAVAVEQVVPGDGVEAGVGAVARVDAVDEGRDAAGDGELAHGRPLPDGREVAGDLHGRVGGAGQPVGPLQDVGNEPFLERVERGRRGALEEVELLLAAGLPRRRGVPRDGNGGGGFLGLRRQVGRAGLVERRLEALGGRGGARHGADGARREPDGIGGPGPAGPGRRQVLPVYGNRGGRGETLHHGG